MVKIKLIPIESLLEMQINEENFKLVEVLTTEQYDEGHIPGAISIPVNDLEMKAADLLKKDETIVVYCASYSCHASTNAARKLMELGYTNVLDYKAGKRGWKHGGLKLKES